MKIELCIKKDGVAEFYPRLIIGGKAFTFKSCESEEKATHILNELRRCIDDLISPHMELTIIKKGVK